MIRRRQSGRKRLFSIQADQSSAVIFPVQIKNFTVTKAKGAGPGGGPKNIRKSKVTGGKAIEAKGTGTGDNPDGASQRNIIRSALFVPLSNNV